jgi:purine-binding chemotaxis protein CheW
MQLFVALIFNEHYGIPIIQVQEIIKPTEITPVPKMPAFLEGVINLRGKIVPVVDLYKHFNLGEKKVTDDTRIIVSFVGEQPVGLIVDAVSEVIHVRASQVEAIPSAISSLDSQFVRGVAKMDGQLVIVLNLEMIIEDLERKSKNV